MELQTKFSMTWLSSSDFQLIIRCPGKFFGNRFVPLSVGIELLLNFAHTRSLIFRLVHFVFVFVFLPSFVDNSSARVFLLGVSRLIRKRTSHNKKTELSERLMERGVEFILCD